MNQLQMEIFDILLEIKAKVAVETELSNEIILKANKLMNDFNEELKNKANDSRLSI